MDRVVGEEMELKLGTSFTSPKECSFHTLRYDFKPASVDTNKMATIDVGTNSEITVTFPQNLIFKGSAQPSHKQCILIVNKETGEVILEKLTNNISVKKFRTENKKMNPQIIDQYIAGQKPRKLTSTKPSKMMSSSISGGIKNKTSKNESNMNSLAPMISNSSRNSPSSQVRFPNGLSPLSASPAKPSIDDQAALDDWLSSVDSGRNSMKVEANKITVKEDLSMPSQLNDEVGELSSSSDGSSSSGDSDSSSDSESQPKKKVSGSGLMNGSPNPQDLLKEDLQLSESGSDSD